MDMLDTIVAVLVVVVIIAALLNPLHRMAMTATVQTKMQKSGHRAGRMISDLITATYHQKKIGVCFKSCHGG